MRGRCWGRCCKAGHTRHGHWCPRYRLHQCPRWSWLTCSPHRGGRYCSATWAPFTSCPTLCRRQRSNHGRHTHCGRWVRQGKSAPRAGWEEPSWFLQSRAQSSHWAKDTCSSSSTPAGKVLLHGRRRRPRHPRASGGAPGVWPPAETAGSPSPRGPPSVQGGTGGLMRSWNIKNRGSQPTTRQEEAGVRIPAVGICCLFSGWS